MRIIDAQIHTWGAGLPSNLSHPKVMHFTPEDAIALIGVRPITPRILVTGGERNLLPNSSIRALHQKPQQRLGCGAKIAVTAVNDGYRNRGAHRWNVERH